MVQVEVDGPEEVTAMREITALFRAGLREGS